MSKIILAPLAALAFTITACGVDDDESAPPPVTPGTSDTVFALQDGTYYVEEIHDLQDGCGKKPLAAEDSLTQVPFNLVNDDGVVTLDFCSFGGTSLHGAVRGNSGTLAVLHNGRRDGSDDYPRIYDQDCRLEMAVTADDHLEGRYVEAQRNRNEAQQFATGTDVSECTTSFRLVMTRKD